MVVQAGGDKIAILLHMVGGEAHDKCNEIVRGGLPQSRGQGKRFAKIVIHDELVKNNNTLLIDCPCPCPCP